jgi:NAD(P)-dependent dehydrogenase (short-subunit alcohol dehydrogenase family)
MTPAPTLTVVSGASGDLGRRVVARLVGEGHLVLAVARRPEALADLAAGRQAVTTCTADLADDRSVAAVAAAVGDQPVRMAVHMAAAPLGGHILDTPASTVVEAIEVKVNGLLRLVRAVLPNLAAGARVVAVGGNLGFEPMEAVSTAGIANAAQASAVRQLAQALGRRGITCHTVAPGPTATERWLRMTEAQAAHDGVAVEDIRARAAAESPLGRLVAPDEVAWAIARLADPEAAALTGSTLLLDGGRRRGLP